MTVGNVAKNLLGKKRIAIPGAQNITFYKIIKTIGFKINFISYVSSLTY